MKYFRFLPGVSKHRLVLLQGFYKKKVEEEEEEKHCVLLDHSDHIWTCKGFHPLGPPSPWWNTTQQPSQGWLAGPEVLRVDVPFHAKHRHRNQALRKKRVEETAVQFPVAATRGRSKKVAFHNSAVSFEEFNVAECMFAESCNEVFQTVGLLRHCQIFRFRHILPHLSLPPRSQQNPLQPAEPADKQWQLCSSAGRYETRVSGNRKVALLKSCSQIFDRD